MHIGAVVVLDALLFLALPFWLIYREVGALCRATLIGAPFLTIAAFLYDRYWKPRSWATLRSGSLPGLLYDLPMERHGPGADFDPSASRNLSRKFVVGIHPHGLYPYAAGAWFTCNRRFLRFRTCVHWMLTTIPLLKEACSWGGAIDATASVMNEHLARRDVQGLVVCPGSVREGTIEKPGTVVQRSGFIQIAMEHKAHLVPVYDATSPALYDIWLPLGTTCHRWLRYPWPVMAKGRSPAYLNPLPKRMTVHVYIGTPIMTENRSLGECIDAFYRQLAELRDMARRDGNLPFDEKWTTAVRK